MTFFNPKEEVLDIQLTQYGRHLLSKGTMKPVYYAFFDEGIVYDSQNSSHGGGFPESKNNAEKRIQLETPYMKTQHCFTGREEFLFDGVNDTEDRLEIGIYERMHTLTDELGTSELGSTKMPFFTMSMLDGEIEKVVTVESGSVRTNNIPEPESGTTTFSQQILKIPQIDIDVTYDIAVIDPLEPAVKFEIDSQISSDKIYGNGLGVAVGTDDIMILIDEGNTVCGLENFQIEVFEKTGEFGSMDEEIYRPLAFEKKLELVQDNLLLTEEEARKRAGISSNQVMELDSSFVEYFLDIKVDREINNSLVCAALSKVKNRGETIYSPCGIDVECPDLDGVIVTDIYASDADEQEC
jgi:hypothetical protein